MTGLTVKIVTEFIARFLYGPMQFRFFVQPLIALALGVRDGVSDSRSDSPPFIWALLYHPDVRSGAFRSALKRMQGPILFASVLDAVAQYLMFRHVRPFAAVLVGTLLMGVPYSVARGVANRIRSKRLADRISPVPAPYKN